MYDPVGRENGIMEILRKFTEIELEFVVVGGYAVSAFRHRFSIDADIVIRREDRENFEKILRENNYQKTMSMQLENVYSSEFVRYENREIMVSVDLLIGGIGIRQTRTSFGFEFLMNNSKERPIEGIEKAVNVRVPRREILVILKLHSGRLTDLRDVAALSFSLNMDMVRKHLFRGNQKVLREHMEKLKSLIEKPEFQDSFKGVFMEKCYRIDQQEIKRLALLKPVD